MNRPSPNSAPQTLHNMATNHYQQTSTYGPHNTSRSTLQSLNLPNSVNRPIKRDTSMDVDPEPEPIDTNTVGKTHGQNNFVIKLYSLVDDPKTDHLICWGPGGASIIVPNSEALNKEVLVKTFKQSSFQSFVRQLNMYDFHKTNRAQRAVRGTGTTQAVQFSHPNFRKGKPNLLHQIKRKSKDNNGPQPGEPGPSMYKPNMAQDDDDQEVDHHRSYASQQSIDVLSAQYDNLKNDYQDVVKKLDNLTHLFASVYRLLESNPTFKEQLRGSGISAPAENEIRLFQSQPQPLQRTESTNSVQSPPLTCSAIEVSGAGVPMSTGMSSPEIGYTVNPSSTSIPDQNIYQYSEHPSSNYSFSMHQQGSQQQDIIAQQFGNQSVFTPSQPRNTSPSVISRQSFQQYASSLGSAAGQDVYHPPRTPRPAEYQSSSSAQPQVGRRTHGLTHVPSNGPPPPTTSSYWFGRS